VRNTASRELVRLRAALERAQGESEDTASLAALELVAAPLLVAIEAVQSAGDGALVRDEGVRSLLVSARKKHASLERRISELRRPPPPPAPDARTLVERLRLRRCRECDSNVLLVIEGATLDVGPLRLPCTMVVCRHCGEARTYVEDPALLGAA
jgi:hypothetical protein